MPPQLGGEQPSDAIERRARLYHPAVRTPGGLRQEQIAPTAAAAPQGLAGVHGHARGGDRNAPYQHAGDIPNWHTRPWAPARALPVGPSKGSHPVASGAICAFSAVARKSTTF